LKIVHKRKKETDRFIDFIRKNLEELEQANTKEDWERIKVRINESLGDKKGETKKPKKKEEIHKPREYISSDGFTILVGKNNEENDYLTFQIAAPEDFWFHAQQVPGSHVVLKRKDKKNEPSKMAIEQTAQIAAYYSRARTSKKVPVIYTLAKYVKKARGSKPGLVVVSKEKSILVEPKLPTQP
jgi:predicted ribosome quality control (RQC) complex YloA/Tae2 family protein